MRESKNEREENGRNSNERWGERGVVEREPEGMREGEEETEREEDRQKRYIERN